MLARARLLGEAKYRAEQMNDMALQSKQPVLTLTLPEVAFTMGASILEACWQIKEMTGQIPDPFWVATLPNDYLDQLFAFDQAVNFYQDYAKRPAAMTE